MQDEAGRLVPDLARDDFEVFDNGKPQALTVFANDVQPITIVIMLDRSGSMMWSYGLVRDAAEQFVGDLLPDDRARTRQLQQPRSDRPGDVHERSRRSSSGFFIENLQDAGPTPLWNATSAAMNALESQPGRRVVLVFTDGKDSPPNPIGNATFSEVRDRSQKDETMVYAIGLANGCALAASAAAPEPSRFARPSSAESRVARRCSSAAAVRCASPAIRLPPIGGRIGFPPFGMPRIEPPPPPVGMPKSAAERSRLDDVGRQAARQPSPIRIWRSWLPLAGEVTSSFAGLTT